MRECWDLETKIRKECEMERLKSKAAKLFNENLDIGFGFSNNKDRSVRDVNLERWFT